MTKLSIITVNYNNYSGLEKTIKSVISQNIHEYEYIIIDGNSTDKSKYVIESYKNSIDIWVSEPDKGIYNAMNKGVEMAKGEYLLFLNSGDYFYDNQVLAKNIEHVNIFDLIAFDIQEKGQGIDRIKSHPREITFEYLFNNTLAHQSVFIKRELFKNVGLYDENLRIVSDWKFFINAFVYNRCSYKTVNQPLTVYSLDGISSTGEGTFIRKKEREIILKKEFHLFYNNYKEKAILESNRFKMLKELESNKFAQKLNSIFLRTMLYVFKRKTIKNL